MIYRDSTGFNASDIAQKLATSRALLRLYGILHLDGHVVTDLPVINNALGKYFLVKAFEILHHTLGKLYRDAAKEFDMAPTDERDEKSLDSVATELLRTGNEALKAKLALKHGVRNQ